MDGISFLSWLSLEAWLFLRLSHAPLLTPPHQNAWGPNRVPGRQTQERRQAICEKCRPGNEMLICNLTRLLLTPMQTPSAEGSGDIFKSK